MSDSTPHSPASATQESVQPAGGPTEPAESAPAGVRTFVIGDIRGFTAFMAQQGDEAGARLSQTFAVLAGETAAQCAGDLLEVRGDEVLLTFSSPRQALKCALALQDRLEAERCSGLDGLQAGIGIDAGEAVPVNGGFRGSALNRAARLCALAGPGEVLITEGLAHLTGRVEGVEYGERGRAQLKGFAEPVTVLQVQRGRRTNGSPTGNDAPMVTASGASLAIAGYLGALPSRPLVDREAELTRGQEIVDAVAAGSGRLLLVTGEPGVGKTRLSQEITRVVHNRGFRIAAGSCYEASEAIPYYPFIEILQSLRRTSPPELHARMLQTWPYLGRLLPGLGTDAPSGENPAEDRQRLFWSLTSFLTDLVTSGPVALLLDDLHWADATTLDLLQHLAHTTRTLPILLLATYRDVEVHRGHPLEATLRELRRQQLCESISLKRLGREATRELLISTLGSQPSSEVVVDLIFGRTDGNPFFVEEIGKTLAGQSNLDAPQDLDVPESIRSLIGQRLSRLDDACQDVLRQAATLGYSFEFEDLLAMDGQDEEGLESLIQEAVAAGILVDLSGSKNVDGYSFNHALTQQTIYAEIPPRRRRRLHLAAGSALERLPPSRRDARAAELARHFLDGDSPAKALEYSLLAGGEASRMFAHREAAEHFRCAVELAREVEDESSVMLALERLGEALTALGRYREALEVLDEAARGRHGRGELEAELRCLALIGVTHAFRGTADEGTRRLQEAETTVSEDSASDAAASFYVALAGLHFIAGRFPAQLQAALRASAIAARAGNEKLIGQAEGRIALALMSLQCYGEALVAFEKAIEIAERHGDADSLQRNCGNMALTLYALGENDRAGRSLARAGQVAEAMGTASSRLLTTHGVASLAYMHGDWDRAISIAESYLSSDAGGELSRGSTETRLLLSAMLFDRTGSEDALSQMEEARKLGAEIGNWQLESEALLFLSMADLARGRADRVMDRLPNVERSGSTMATAAAALARLELGDSAAALGMVDRRLTIVGNRAEASFLLYSRGRALHRLGRLDEAAQALEESVTRLERIPHVYYVATSLEALGAVYRDQGRIEDVRAAWERALGGYRQVKAAPAMARLEEKLRREPAPPDPSTARQ